MDGSSNLGNLSASSTFATTSVAAICGKWHRDRHLSDSVEPVLDILQLGGLLRKTVQIGLSRHSFQISQEPAHAVLRIAPCVPGIRFIERLPLDHSDARPRRRDLRGAMTARIYPGKPGPRGGLLMDMEWEAPAKGCQRDEIVLVPAGTAAAELQARKAQQQAKEAAAAAGSPHHTTSLTPPTNDNNKSNITGNNHIKSTTGINNGTSQVDLSCVLQQRVHSKRGAVEDPSSPTHQQRDASQAAERSDTVAGPVEMHVHSHYRVGEKELLYRSVYRHG